MSDSALEARINSYKIELPYNYESKIRAISVSPALKLLPEGIIYNINNVSKDLTQSGKQLTAMNLLNIMFMTAMKAVKPGAPHPVFIEANELLLKYLDVIVLNQVAHLDVAAYLREKISEAIIKNI